MTNPSRPFPAIVEQAVIDLIAILPIKTTEIGWEKVGEDAQEAIQVILQAVKQLIEDGMPEKKKYDAAKALRAGTYYRGEDFTVKGYNQAIDHIRNTLLAALK